MFKFFSKKEIWLPIVILIVVGGFVYSFNLNNQLFWDDNDWIINNNFVHAISWDNIKFWFTHDVLAGIGLTSNYYRPFLFLTFAFNYIISGVNPLGYHLFSNLIHIANGILVFLLIQRVFKKKLIAFLTSLIFLIHPLQTEAVTYISGRGDVLVVFFMLLAILFFYKAENSIMASQNRIFGFSMSKFISVAFLILGVLSRETGIIFPFLALFIYVSFISEERFLRSIWRGLSRTWIYFAVVLAYGILRLTSLNFINTLNFYQSPNIYSEHLHVRLFTFLHVLVDYFKLLFVPTGLHMERSTTVHTSLFQWPVWLGALIVFSILVVLCCLYKNRHPDFKIWLLGWGWFFIALGPVSGVTPINAVIYEHWLYLPMVGFWLIVSFYLVRLFDYLKSRSFNIFYLMLAAILTTYFSFFGFQAIKRNILWGNPAEFYKNILEYEPGSARINNNLGNTYFNQGDKEQAEFYYRKAIESANTFAQPYYNLGTILQSRGDISGAIQLYKKAIEINPDFYYSYQNLAFIYAQQGDLLKAADNIEKLKILIPTNPRVYYNSALVYLALNDKKKALEDLQAGLKYTELDPETRKLIEELFQQLQK